MRMSNHPTYLEMRSWFLKELKRLIPKFYKLIKSIAQKHGVRADSIILILQNEELWPHLSSSLYRALSLVQEVIIWTKVPAPKHQNLDVSKINDIILELAMTLYLKVFPHFEMRFNNYIDELSITTEESFLDLLEIFERGLAQDNFHLKPIVLGIVVTQFESLKF